MIEAAQVRAARALIGWSQAELADAARLPLSTVDRFETGAPDSVTAEAVAKMRAALEATAKENGWASLYCDGRMLGLRGNVTRNVVPSAELERTSSSPRCALTIA